MINPLLLIESLQKTYVFRPRSYFWLARQHNNLEQFSSKLEEMKNIPIDKAEKYIRNAVSLEAAELLKDFNLKSLIINAENAPTTYQLFFGDGIESIFGGENND